MSDLNLLSFGCGIFFALCAGVYVGAREQFVYAVRGRRITRSERRARRRAARRPAQAAL